MPQLDLSTFPSQLFWLAITFLGLYLLMARKALPTVREVLQNRHERINSDLEKAAAVKEEAESAKQNYTSALQSARAEANHLLSDATQRIKADAQSRHAQLDETLARQIAETEALMEKTRKEALVRMQAVSVELSQIIVEKLVGVKADPTKLHVDLGTVSKEQRHV